MELYFDADDHSTYNDLLIEIDSFGRIHVNLDESTWEGGGVEDEIITIIMEYVAKIKYLK